MQNANEIIKNLFFWKEIKYNKNFLEKYIPNKTSFLNSEQLKLIKEQINNKEVNYSIFNNKLYEKIILDLSYSSSYFENNSCSKKEAEEIIKFNNLKIDWKDFKETKMILNHKYVIENILFNKDNINIDFNNLMEIHKYLAKELVEEKYIWKIRNEEVKIWWTWYIPLKEKIELNIELEKFLIKLNNIKEPIEQSLFILIFIPYLQLFIDVNKRTSRIFANIPLIKNNLPIFIFNTKYKEIYKEYLLKIYNNNDFKDFVNLFVENYIENIKNSN